MKIENGVLYGNGPYWLAKVAKHGGHITINNVHFSPKDATELARYLAHFGETGKLEEQRPNPFSGPCKSIWAPENKCEHGSVYGLCAETECTHYNVRDEATKSLVDDQQLAREKLAFWEKVFLVSFNSDDTAESDALNADEAVREWLKRRTEYGVK